MSSIKLNLLDESLLFTDVPTPESDDFVILLLLLSYWSRDLLIERLLNIELLRDDVPLVDDDNNDDDDGWWLGGKGGNVSQIVEYLLLLLVFFLLTPILVDNNESVLFLSYDDVPSYLLYVSSKS